MEKWASHEDMNDEDRLVNVQHHHTACRRSDEYTVRKKLLPVSMQWIRSIMRPDSGQSYTLTGQLIEKATGKVFVDGQTEKK